MDDGDTESGLLVQVKDAQPGTADFGQPFVLAAQVLAQDRYLVSSVPGGQESRVLGAFDGTRCAGFLRYLVQVLGAEAGRPAVTHNGEPLRKATRRPSGSIRGYAAAASEPRSSSKEAER